MRYRITIRIDPAFTREIEPKLLRTAARAALEHQAAPAPGELAVVLTDDAALQALNRDYAGHDYATDVLSFPSGVVSPETGAYYFGDVALSYPRALAQAQTGGHPVSAEVQLLVVHGVLHLLGHDHAAPQEKARMWAAQADILESLNETGPKTGVI